MKTRREIEVALERAGAVMANILFNVAQRPNELLMPHVAESMDTARRAWDRAHGDWQQINHLTGGAPDLIAAVDVAFPLPDTPHTSVASRAIDDRAAFTKGWVAALASQVPGEAVAWCVKNPNGDDPPVLIYGNGYALKPGDKLYTTPTAPVLAAEAASVDTPELRGLVNSYIDASENVQGHAIPQWRELIAHVTSQVTKAREEVAQHQQSYIDQLAAKLAGTDSMLGIAIKERDALAAAPATPSVPEGWRQALKTAVASLYFDDSSDFKAHLGTIVRHLDPALAAEFLCEPRKAYLRACEIAAAPQAAQPEAGPSDKLQAYLDASQALEQQAAPSDAGEREAFEGFIADKYPNMPREHQVRYDGSIEYKSAGTEHRWKGWQARAAAGVPSAPVVATSGATMRPISFSVYQHEDDPLRVGDLDGSREFCRVFHYEDGDRGYYALAKDQSGTELEELLNTAAPAPSDGAIYESASRKFGSAENNAEIDAINAGLLAAPVAAEGDSIAKSKRILALVDEYHERPTQHTRTSLRVALMDEFDAALKTAQAQPAPQPVELSDDTKRLDLLIRYCSSNGGHFVLIDQKWHFTNPRGRIVGVGNTERAAIDAAIQAAKEKAS